MFLELHADPKIKDILNDKPCKQRKTIKSKIEKFDLMIKKCSKRVTLIQGKERRLKAKIETHQNYLPDTTTVEH